jgi:dolichyl-phosphate beta-glucosyltransferase
MTAASPAITASRSIALILPAYNEEARIGRTLRSISAYERQRRVDWPVVVADDGSTDDTPSVAEGLAAELGLPLEVVSYPHRGKALTVRDAMLDAASRRDADYLMMLDADDEISIDQLDHVDWALDGRTIYIARRVAEANGKVGTRATPLRRVMSAGMRFASWILLGLRFPDTQCGFKLFPRSLVPELFGQQRSAGWVFDAELLVIATRVSRLPVVEVPVTWTPRGQSRVTTWAAVTSALAILEVAARYRSGRYRPIGRAMPQTGVTRPADDRRPSVG